MSVALVLAGREQTLHTMVVRIYHYVADMAHYVSLSRRWPAIRAGGVLTVQIPSGALILGRFSPNACSL
jgi:hypothetical protein